MILHPDNLKKKESEWMNRSVQTIWRFLIASMWRNRDQIMWIVIILYLTFRTWTWLISSLSTCAKKLATVSLFVFITEQLQDSVGLLANVIEQPFTIVQNNRYDGTEYLEDIPHGYLLYLWYRANIQSSRTTTET